MPTDINRLLTQMQTGEYVPTDEEKILLEQVVQGPEKRRLGQAAIDQLSYNQFDARRQDALGMEAALAGYGQSRYDKGEFVPDADLENKRAIEQPGAWKIANGAIKGGVYAATTAVETVAGVIDGLIEGVVELGKQVLTDEKFSPANVIGKGVNNFTARTMQDIQRLSDEWFSNYRTTVERTPEYQENWQRHIFSANFIGDQFLKNFGFTVGAIGGGMVWSKILGSALRAKSANDLLKGVTAAASGNPEAVSALSETLKLVETGAAQTLDDAAIRKGIINGAKGLNKSSAKQMMFGSVIGAMGEGTMEGVMAREEFLDNYIEQINNDYLQSRETAREQLTKELEGTSYTRAELRLDENGKLVPVYALNEDGEKLLKERQDELAGDYTKKRKFADEVGDRIAATTFLLNLPILTISNTVQFGKLFSGGWKSARKTASVAGGIKKEAEKIASDYAATGSKALKVAQNAIKVGVPEAAEEMAQGFVSSGAQRVADARLTAFTDSGYDMKSMREYGSWLGNFIEGGNEYLSDWKNWQEGFMGLITGLVGMPGRGYFKGQRGGMAGAIAEANEDLKASKTAADALNTRINSKKFQDAWEGYVRHMKYEAQMGNAVQRDDQYSWRTANDTQLISDIIMFADAGRLQDLYDIVDTYANMSPQEAKIKGVDEAVTSESNKNQVDNNPEEAIKKVKEQAETIKENISMYNEMYDALSARAPIGVSDAQLKELVATSMGIRAFEKRYLSMFDEVIKGLEKYVKPLSLTDVDGNELNAKETIARAKDIYSTFTEIYTGTGLPVDTPLLRAAEIMKTMDRLGKMVDDAKDTELRKKLDDMQKVSEDRAAFLKKLFTLQNLAPAKFGEKIQTPEKATTEVQKENARKVTEGLNTMVDVRNRYYGGNAKDKADLMNAISPLYGENKAITDFIDIKNAVDKFRAYFETNGIEYLPSVTPDMTMHALGDLLRRVNSVKELESLPDTAFESSNEFLQRNKKIFGAPIGVSTYEAMKETMRGAMAEYLAKESQTESKDKINPNAEVKSDPGTTSNPEGYDAAQASSVEVAPDAESNNEEVRAEQAETVEEQEDEEAAPEVDEPTFDDTIEDAMDVGEETLPEDIADEKIVNSGESAKTPFLRASAPEVLSGYAKEGEPGRAGDARDAIKNRDVEAYKACDLSDAWTKIPGMEKTGEALNDLHAFDNVALRLSVNDEISFEIDPSFPLDQNGDIQVMLVTYKDGERVVLNLLSKQFSKYYGLEDLWEEIRDEYDAADKTQLFTFSKKSNVWAKRPGLMEYGDEEKGIINIPNYNEDAPIVYIDKNGHASVVNGKDNDAIFKVSPTFTDADYNKTHKRRRALYYLAKDGDNAYIPIRLKKAEGAVIERSATGEFTNLAQLINDGLITSNATKLRPKGVDFYMDAWIPRSVTDDGTAIDGHFGLVTDTQRKWVENETDVKPTEERQVESIEEILGEDTFAGREGLGQGVPDLFGLNFEEEHEQMNEIPAHQWMREYKDLGESEKEKAQKEGYDEKKWNSESFMMRKQVLEC